MERLKRSVFCLAIVTLFACGSSWTVGNVCRNVQEIPCDNKQCILRGKWCDGTVDCNDESDEEYCRLPTSDDPFPNWCSLTKHFECGDKRCFPATVECDNINDCCDFSDEQDCGTTTTTVATGRFEEKSTAAASLLTGNYDSREEPSRFSSNQNPRLDVHTTIEPTVTHHYEARRMQSANQNGRFTQNESNPHQDRQDYNTHNRRHDQFHNRNDYQNYDYYGRHDQNHNRNNHRNQDYYGSRDQNNRNDHRNQDYYGRNDRSRNHNYGTVSSNYSPPQSPDSNTRRSGLILIPPRSVLYPPEVRTSHSNRNRQIQRPAFTPFHFRENYTDRYYDENIRKAKEWILARRDHLYSWGSDTPRALVALSLMTNSFSSNKTENDLMRKSLKTHLGLKLLRNNTGIEKMSTTRLAMYIHALLATCLDPRDFWGMDLTEILRSRRNHLEPHQTFVNPLLYLSLCLTDQPITQGDMSELVRLLVSRFPDEVSKDLHILATISLACLSHHDGGENRFRDLLEEAFQNLLTQRNSTDGSFGSIYSTALAAQAFMSSNLPVNFPLDVTLRTLSESQSEDGSFGDMQATYYVVLALSGRSLVHLRNTQCDRAETDEGPVPPPDCPKKKLFLTLRVGYPEIFSTSIQLTMCDGGSAFEAMRMAADLDPRFKFHYKITNGQLGVHTIVNVPSDAERGLFWNLYVLLTPSEHVDTRQRYTGDIRELIPRDGAELLYWYLPIQLN